MARIPEVAKSLMIGAGPGVCETSKNRLQSDPPGSVPEGVRLSVPGKTKTGEY